MQNLLEIITEYKEVALRRDSVGSAGKSLNSSNTLRIGLYNSETVNTAEYFSVQRNLHLLRNRLSMLYLQLLILRFF